MELNSSSLESLRTVFHTNFLKGLSLAEPQWSRYGFAMKLNAVGEKSEIPTMESWPALIEWEGDKQFGNVKAGTYSINNVWWENSISVHKKYILRDKWGAYESRFQAMGQAARQHEDKILFDVLTAGWTATGQDGKAFFGATHLGSGTNTQTNATTNTLTATAYAGAYAAMQGFTDLDGNYLNVTPNLLIVPPALKDKAKTILKAQTIGGTTNIHEGECDYLVTPHIGAAYWFLADTTKPIKPLIFQEEQAPSFYATTDPTDSEVIKSGNLLYSTEVSRAAGYGMWQLIYGSTGAS